MYYFTFGAGQAHDGCYVIIHEPMYLAARQVMVARFGTRWSGQYSHQQFDQLGLADRMELYSVFSQGEWDDL